MSLIKISVIIPVFNVEKFLGKCLDSIINQTLKEIEIICVDDGSSDDSIKILKEYKNKDSRIKILFQKNNGAGVARNKGMEIAKGDYYAFVDSDDWLELDALENLYNNAISNNSDIVFFNAIEHGPNNQFRKRIYFKPDPSIDYNNFTFDYNYKKNMVMNSFLVIWSKIYKASFIKENNIKFSEFRIFNDVKFHIVSTLLAKRMSYLPEILYNYRKINQISLQNTHAVTDKGFILFELFNDIENYLKKNKFYDEFEINFINFKINESKGRLIKTDELFKEKLFKMIRSDFLDMNIPTSYLNKLPFDRYRFYIHVINFSNYNEFKKFIDRIDENNINCHNKLESYNKTMNLSQNYEDVLKKISEDIQNNNLINFKAIKKINELSLFDYDFYIKKYNYNSNLNPLLHYIYQGYKEGKNPNKNFNGDYYLNFYEEVKKSNLNPLVYFVLFGLDEGKFKFNESMRNVKTINKIELSNEIYDFNNLGITKIKRKVPIIISLTSFPERMYDIHFSLYSLLNQNFKPDKIILWLSVEEFPNKEEDIPKDVLNLKKNGLTIKWCENIKSYKKLIPTLKEYENSIIVTADDDLFYPQNWLEMLYKSHEKNPNCIISCRAKKINFNSSRKINEYNNWPLINKDEIPSFFNFPTNGAGSLFPLNSFYSDVYNKNLFFELAPNSDDIWFWAMAVLNKKKVKVIENNMAFLTYVNPARELSLFNEKTLWSYNKKGGNDEAFKKVLNKYPEILNILLEEYNNR